MLCESGAGGVPLAYRADLASPEAYAVAFLQAVVGILGEAAVVEFH